MMDIYIGSHMSTIVLLNLFNELRKRDQILYCNKLNKFNNTGARMLDSINHIKQKFLCQDYCHIYADFIMTVIT